MTQGYPVDMEQLCISTYQASSYINQTGWDRFTHQLLSRPLFRVSSNFRISLRVLLDFLKAEKSFYTDPRITPNPITNMYIESEMVHYRYGKGCMQKLDEYWNSECHDDLDTIGYYGIDTLPFHFVIKSKSSSNVLRGIVYTDDDYLFHQHSVQIKSRDRFPGPIFNDDACEEFHIFNHMGRRYVITFLTEGGKNIPRCSTPLPTTQNLLATGP
jgi:hypothetical protein